MADLLQQSIFDGIVTHVDQTDYSGFAYQALDFGQPSQFNVDKGGEPFLHVLDIPRHLRNLKDDKRYGSIIKNSIWVLENKFRGLDGIENITTETMTIENGYETVELINKVQRPTSSKVTMEYDEMVGGLLTKFTELYLEGLQDTRTHYTHYMEQDNVDDPFVARSPDVADEIFQFLYYITDTTGVGIKKAFILGLGQITESPYSNMYNDKRGEKEKKTFTLNLNCVPFTDATITGLARDHVKAISKIRRRNDNGRSYIGSYSIDLASGIYGGPKTRTNPTGA